MKYFLMLFVAAALLIGCATPLSDADKAIAEAAASRADFLAMTGHAPPYMAEWTHGERVAFFERGLKSCDPATRSDVLKYANGK